MTHDRAAAAERVLAAHGIAAHVAEVGDIAAVTVPAARLGELTPHAPALRALGFRYVAIDITPAERPVGG